LYHFIRCVLPISDTISHTSNMIDFLRSKDFLVTGTRFVDVVITASSVRLVSYFPRFPIFLIFQRFPNEFRFVRKNGQSDCRQPCARNKYFPTYYTHAPRNGVRYSVRVLIHVWAYTHLVCINRIYFTHHSTRYTGFTLLQFLVCFFPQVYFYSCKNEIERMRTLIIRMQSNMSDIVWMLLGTCMPVHSRTRMVNHLDQCDCVLWNSFIIFL
jgi:hypothetical protein